MKDKYFYNVAKLLEKIIGTLERSTPHNYVFAFILMQIEPLLEEMDYLRDNLDREVDGETVEVNPLFDNIDNPDFIISADEAMSVVQRHRRMTSIHKRVKDVCETRNKKIRDENSFLAALCSGGNAMRPKKKEMRGQLELAEEFLKIHYECEADEYGRLGIMHALPAPIAYMMCRMRKNELEAIAENSGRELIGTKRTEYTNLVHKMDEIRPILMQLREQYPGEFEIDRVLGDEDEDLWAAD